MEVFEGPTDETSPTLLETVSAPLELRPKLGLSLFWRTFFLLAVLLVCSTVATLQTFRALEYEPRALQAANQIASLVNLSRSALVYSDSISRVLLIKQLADQEGMRILPREPTDKFEPYDKSNLDKLIAEELIARLGADTVVASSVNGEGGLWVAIGIGADTYWLLMDPSRVYQLGGRTWLIWLLIAVSLSLAGAAVIARLINRPLKLLSFATSRLRDGDFEASHLDEGVVTSEIRQVNIGFNRMADQLAKIEQSRAVMLAGISHDLRTPLARLRLEAELSVSDADARAHMASDIEQLDSIVDKFMDYARPDHVNLNSVSLNAVIDACVYSLEDDADIRISVDLPKRLMVLADEVELKRVISNLLENARRYGKSADTGIALVNITARARDAWVLLRVRDHGAGVPAEQLSNLTQPFFRGDAARTEANGAGLGLSIVEKNIHRMGGRFVLTNTASGGLAAHIKLQSAP
jgi:two-component system osmolarity sensor histidine kinase EnvZ